MPTSLRFSPSGFAVQPLERQALWCGGAGVAGVPGSAGADAGAQAGRPHHCDGAAAAPLVPAGPALRHPAGQRPAGRRRACAVPPPPPSSLHPPHCQLLRRPSHGPSAPAPIAEEGICPPLRRVSEQTRNEIRHVVDLCNDHAPISPCRTTPPAQARPCRISPAKQARCVAHWLSNHNGTLLPVPDNHLLLCSAFACSRTLFRCLQFRPWQWPRLLLDGCQPAMPPHAQPSRQMHARTPHACVVDRRAQPAARVPRDPKHAILLAYHNTFVVTRAERLHLPSQRAASAQSAGSRASPPVFVRTPFPPRLVSRRHGAEDSSCRRSVRLVAGARAGRDPSGAAAAPAAGGGT